MSTIRWDPRRQGYPGISGRLMVDVWRGQIRARKWPAKRGQKMTDRQRAQVEWFRDVTAMVKYAPPSQVKSAMLATKGSGMYPRDLLMRLVSEGWTDLVLPDGSVIEHKQYFLEETVFQGARLYASSSFVTPASSFFAPTWPVPAIDTAGFWNPAEPTLLTIPSGVNIVRFEAGLGNIGGTATAGRILIMRGASEPLAKISIDTVADTAATASTGPINVSAGDKVAAFFLTGVAKTVNAGPATYFSVEVLDAS